MEIETKLVFLPFIILFIYVVWRLLTYGAARSYFQAKLWFVKKIKFDRKEAKKDER